MKIICKIENNAWLDYGEAYYPLALNFSLKRGIEVYIQAGKDNTPIWKSLSCFEVIDQTIPSSWVRKDYGDPRDGIMSFMPEKWTYPGFFEDLCDDVIPAVNLFNEEAIKIYKEMKAPGYE